MLEPGAIVGGDYRVERKLSEGGMGAVFVAEQISTGAKRALKVIRSELLHEPKLRARFEQEAKVTSKIESDHVVSVVAAGFDAELELPWLAMELLTGETLLEAVTARGSLPRPMALAILKQLAHAMDAAHAAGIVHRDLKSENIFLADAKRSGVPFFVKVLDFGIARVVREAQASKTDSLGTPLWMSPEQTGTGENVGPTTDVWSLGLITFYVLTGRSYWLSASGEGTTLGIVKEICFDPLPPASERARALGCERAIPAGFDAWFARTVTRDVPARFPSFGAAINELDAIVGAATSEAAFAATEPIVSAQPTPAAVPPAVSITNPTNEAAKKSGTTKAQKAVAALAIVALGGAVVIGVRAMNQRRELQAFAGVTSRDAEEARRNADTLKTLCDRGDARACAVLGHARAFPPSSAIERAPETAVALLEKACAKGRGCALLGSLKQLGWKGIGNDASRYFDAACKAPPVDAEGILDCELVAARDPARKLGFELQPLDACTKHGGDLCALAWLAKDAAPKDVQAAYQHGCDDGSALACNNLAAMRAEGYAGLEPSPMAAGELFERACAVGEPAACNNAAFLAGGFLASPRYGPRGARVYKLRCGGAIQVGCAGWGERKELVPRGTPVDVTQGANAFDKGCSTGLSTACVNLGALVYIGRGVARDRARAETLFAENCFRGDASACGEQGAALLALRMDHPRDRRGAMGFLQRACSAGEEDACSAMYAQMLEEPAREKEGAAGLERLSAREIYSHALAQLYETGGVHVAKKPEEARRVALKMCETDHHCADAAYYLARGIGGGRDDRRALDSLVRGCDHEDYGSCTELAVRYRDGIAVSRDATRAADIFRRACDGAEPTACNELSRAHLAGAGVSKDPAKALALARTACDGGSAEGCATVGVMLAEGQGAAKDPNAATPYLAFGCRRAVHVACEKLAALGVPLPELDVTQ
jgi:eukaryotic-like serine/threonine-protein kinase